MTNKEIIVKKLNGTGFKLGCWDNEIERVPKAEMFKITSSLLEGWTNVHVKIRGKEYIVEIATVDDEVDLTIKSEEEYRLTYGED